MSKIPAPLRWERPQANALYAYRGDHVMGMVVKRSTDGLYAWKMDGVHAKWITKNYGECTTEASARRAINRAWANWCRAVGLIGEETRA